MKKITQKILLILLIISAGYSIVMTLPSNYNFDSNFMGFKVMRMSDRFNDNFLLITKLDKKPIVGDTIYFKVDDKYMRGVVTENTNEIEVIENGIYSNINDRAHIYKKKIGTYGILSTITILIGVSISNFLFKSKHKKKNP